MHLVIASVFVYTLFYTPCEIGAFEWTDVLPNGTEKSFCEGLAVSFNWGFRLAPSEQVDSVTYYRQLKFQTPDNGNESLWEDGLGTPIDPSEERFNFTSDYAMTISTVSAKDTGIYLMKVVLASANENEKDENVTNETDTQTYVTTASLVVKVSPVLKEKLHAKLHHKAAKVTDGPQPGWHVQLSCGKFLDHGQPPIKVKWTDSSGTVLPSTSYKNGFFLLILPNPVAADSYSCKVDSSAPALACVSHKSPVRSTAMVRVEVMKAHVILLEARLNELIASDSKMAERIAELTARDAELTALDNELTARDTRMAAHDTDLSAKITELTARINELATSDTKLAPRDTELAARHTELKVKDTELAARDTELTNRDIEMTNLKTKLAARIEELEDKFVKKSSSVKDYRTLTANDYRTLTANVLPDKSSGSSDDATCKEPQGTNQWITIQRRYNGSVDFYRGWQQYEDGFGDVMGEFWLGLKKIHDITMCGTYMLRVELEDFDGNTAYAEYSEFFIRGPKKFYSLFVTGYSGTAGDAMRYQNNRRFSAKDQDNDDWSNNCAVVYHGAWWYGACHHSNLNGRYKNEAAEGSDGVVWPEWTNSKYVSLKSVEMKIKRV